MASLLQLIQTKGRYYGVSRIYKQEFSLEIKDDQIKIESSVWGGPKYSPLEQGLQFIYSISVQYDIRVWKKKIRPRDLVDKMKEEGKKQHEIVKAIKDSHPGIYLRDAFAFVKGYHRDIECCFYIQP